MKLFFDLAKENSKTKIMLEEKKNNQTSSK